MPGSWSNISKTSKTRSNASSGCKNSSASSSNSMLTVGQGSGKGDSAGKAVSDTKPILNSKQTVAEKTQETVAVAQNPFWQHRANRWLRAYERETRIRARREFRAVPKSYSDCKSKKEKTLWWKLRTSIKLQVHFSFSSHDS